MEAICHELDKLDAMEKQEGRNRLEELHNFHSQQIDEKKRRAEDEFKKQIEQDAFVAATHDEVEKQFYSYAEKAIRQWQNHGKNIKPLIMELKNFKKRAIY
jgi:hypothetical protein